MQIKLFTIPNMLTLANLFCGMSAIYVTLHVEQNLTLAFIFIIASGVFDFFDGFVARLLNSFSLVGKELDSLADVVSFGVAPSAIMFVVLQNMGSEFAPVAAIIALISALRLAKFNVDESQTSEFIGMPTPANAIFFASCGHLIQTGQIVVTNQWIVIAIILIMSYLLISNVKMFALKFKNFSLKDNYIKYGFIAVAVVGIVVGKAVAIPAVIGTYIAISTITHYLNQK